MARGRPGAGRPSYGVESRPALFARIVRTSGLLGPRVRQTSNAYVLSFPKGLGGLAVAAFKISPERHAPLTLPLLLPDALTGVAQL